MKDKESELITLELITDEDLSSYLVILQLGAMRNACNFSQVSNFSTCSPLLKTFLNNPRGKTVSSQEWLKRQLNDPFVKRAKLHNFRCRSAFKLLQMNDKFGILKAGHVVVDCGASPGSWSQVAAALTNANNLDPKLPVGKVVGIDIRNIAPIDGVTLLFPYDFTQPDAQSKLTNALENRKVDVVLSDMAPSSSGLKEMDHDSIVDLSYHVLRFAALHSKVGATCLVKLWMGRNLMQFEETLKKFYNHVNHVKPEASRENSSEIYLLAREFKGILENIS